MKKKFVKVYDWCDECDKLKKNVLIDKNIRLPIHPWVEIWYNLKFK